MGVAKLEISSDLSALMAKVDGLVDSVKRLTTNTDEYTQRSTAGFNKTAQSADKLKTEIKEQEKILKDMERTAESYAKKQSTLTAQQSAAYKRLQGDIKVATGELKQMHAQQEKTTSKGGAMFSKLGGAIVAAFSVYAVINFAKTALAAWDEQEKVVKKLSIALGGNEDMVRRLTSQAKDLSKTTLFSDEELINVQAMLAFLSKDEKIIKTLTPLVADLAAAKGMDLASAANLVSRSIGSSTNALARQGVVIEGAVGSQERLQSAVTSLTKAFGGQSQAAATVGTASISQMTKAYHELLEAIGASGSTLSPMWEFITGWLNNVADYAFKTKDRILSDARDASFTSALNEDAIEIQKISERLQKSGMDAAAADKRAVELEIISLQKLIGFYGDDAIVVEDLQKRITNLKEGPAKIKPLVESLDSLKEKLKELQAAQSAAPLELFHTFDFDIAELEKQIALYEKKKEEVAKRVKLDKFEMKPILKFDESGMIQEVELFGKKVEIQFNKTLGSIQIKTDGIKPLELTLRDESKKLGEDYQKQVETNIQFAKDHPLAAQLGIEGEDQLNQIKDYAGQVMDFVNQMVDQQVQATERIVEDQNKRIDEQEQLVNREYADKQAGLANSYDLEQENLKKMQAARDEAIKDRERMIKIQRIMSTTESGIALVSAAANIIKGFSSIPVVGVVLGLAAVGAMLTGFLLATSKAKDATKMERGGLLEGRRHTQGGIPMEAEDGEFFINRKSTAKHLPLLEAINRDDRESMKLYFDRNFITKFPNQRSGKDYSKDIGNVVKELKKGKPETIYGPGYKIEKSGGYTKIIHLN